MEKLTTKTYWESYYGKNRYANKQHIVNVCSYYDEFWKIFIGENSSDKTFIEIGGFPGRYLAYLANKYNLHPTCLDYNSDEKQVEQTLHLMNVDSYKILQEDFTTYKTDTTYDYVFSNGFIEHFENFDDILDLHVTYMNERSKLCVIIPNMKGYIKIYKYFVDFNNMKIHNLDCMKLKVFKEFASRNDLKISHLGYFGGFPFSVHQKSNFAQKIIYQVHRMFFKKIGNSMLSKKPSRFFSSTIIAIFEKE